MTATVLEKHKSHRQAQRRLSHWIRMQKWWDALIKRTTGYEVYPRPHEVYRIEHLGHRYAIIFDDPTMGKDA